MTKQLVPLLASLVLAGLPSPGLAHKVGPEFQVNTYTSDFQDHPSVAAGASGNFVVVWEDLGYPGHDGDGFGVFGQRYDSGGNPLGGEFRVNTYAIGNQSSPSVASDASGNFVVVWESSGQDGSASGVFGQRYDSGGSPLGGEFQVNTYTTDLQYAPSVAADTTGNFVVVWASRGQDGSSDGVFGQRYDNEGNPVGGEFQVNTFTTSFQDSPSVALDASGNFVVVWDSFQDGSLTGVFGQRYDAGGNPLGGEFQANTFTTSSQTSVSLASDASGNFVVVWNSFGQDGSADGVFAQRYDNDGNPLGGEFQVNSYTTDRQGEPSVTFDPSGNFVVVWYSFGQDRSSDGVFGQRYDSGGNSLGGEFRINTYTTGAQVSPSVAADANGGFVVLWHSFGQDGSMTGVFGQRFDGITDPLACTDLRTVRVRCLDGNLQVGLVLVDDSHDGETMTLRLNGQDRILTIDGSSAKLSGPGQGLNTLLLVEPSGCAGEKTVQCP